MPKRDKTTVMTMGYPATTGVTANGSDDDMAESSRTDDGDGRQRDPYGRAKLRLAVTDREAGEGEEAKSNGGN
jgi:hypothetical protein